jgi:hypothetical protein
MMGIGRKRKRKGGGGSGSVGLLRSWQGCSVSPVVLVEVELVHWFLLRAATCTSVPLQPMQPMQPMQ